MREEQLLMSIIESHTIQYRLSSTIIKLTDSLCCIQDLWELPDILYKHIGMLMHIDWLAVYLVSKDEDVANIFTNNGVAFDWNELYPKIMEYDRGAPLVMSGKPGDIFLSQEIVDLKHGKDSFVSEFITHHTGARFSLNMPLAKEDENSLILSLYRNDPSKPFTPQDVAFMKKLSPLLKSFSSLMLLHNEYQYRKIMLEDLLQKEDLYIILIDPHLKLVSLPDHTSLFFKEWFGSNTGRHLPPPLEEWIKRVVSPDVMNKGANGPWAMNYKLPAGLLSCTAHNVYNKRKRPLFLVKLKPQHHENDFSILEKMGLTIQEIKVVSYLPYGYTNHQIAQAIGCQEVTIKKHLHDIGEKLHAYGRTEIVYQAMNMRNSLTRDSS